MAVVYGPQLGLSKGLERARVVRVLWRETHLVGPVLCAPSVFHRIVLQRDLDVPELHDFAEESCGELLLDANDGVCEKRVALAYDQVDGRPVDECPVVANQSRSPRDISNFCCVNRVGQGEAPASPRFDDDQVLRERKEPLGVFGEVLRWDGASFRRALRLIDTLAVLSGQEPSRDLDAAAKREAFGAGTPSAARLQRRASRRLDVLEEAVELDGDALEHAERITRHVNLRGPCVGAEVAQVLRRGPEMEVVLA